MKITFDCPDEWETKLKEASKKNGDCAISVICRIALSLFFEKELGFVRFDENNNEREREDNEK